VIEEIRRAGLYEKTWQAFAVLLPVQSVGVMGDGRTYADTIAVRVVDSLDAMTADWTRLPTEVLEPFPFNCEQVPVSIEWFTISAQSHRARSNGVGNPMIRFLGQLLQARMQV